MFRIKGMLESKFRDMDEIQKVSTKVPTKESPKAKRKRERQERISQAALELSMANMDPDLVVQAGEVGVENTNEAELDFFSTMPSFTPCVTQITKVTSVERLANLDGTHDICVQLSVVFETSNGQEVRTVNSSYLKKNCPQFLIDFYEQQVSGDVEVQFKVMEIFSHGQEVVTFDKKMMRDEYPLQLIEFYEQNFCLESVSDTQ